jgi:hypothetical protein
VGGSGKGRGESAVAHLLAALRQALPMSAALGACFLALPIVVAAEQAQQIPATPEARLCAASGEQILAANVIGAAVYQEQFSHYSPRTGRCYVEMRVQIVASDEHADRVGRFLYDGQTKELLAFAQIKGGKKSGRVFDLNHRTTTFENSGWDDASEYVYRMMADDR